MSIKIINNLTIIKILTIKLPRMLGGTETVFEPIPLNFSEYSNIIIVTVKKIYNTILGIKHYKII